MKKLFLSLLVLALFPVTFFSKETARSPYPAISTELSGDVEIKKSAQHVVENNTYKTFELEAPAAGNYYLNFWMMPSRKADGSYTLYEVLVNEKVGGEIIPAKDGWQSIGLSSGSVYLSKGTNIISVVGQVPEIPLVEFVRMSSSLSKAAILSTKYDNYLAAIKAESQALSTETPEQADNSLTAAEAVNLRATTLPNPQGIGQHYLDVDVKYSFYTTLFLYENDIITITSNATYDNTIFSHIIELFYTEGENIPSSHSWIATSTNMLPRSARLTVTIPSDGRYYLKFRPRLSTSSGTVDVGINRYSSFYENVNTSYYGNLPVRGQIYQCRLYKNEYSDNFTCHKTFLNGSPDSYLAPYLWLMTSTAGNSSKIIAHADSWGGDSRLKGITPSYVGGVNVTSSSSYNPEGKCDLYLGYKECTITDYFPNLHPDDAIKSGLADWEYEDTYLEGDEHWASYNCISWTGGMTDHWDWPPSSGWSDYHIEGDDLASFDNFYSSVRYPGCGIYTREGATAENSVIDLWAYLRSDGTIRGYAHASIRKEADDGYPHGYAWESKCGPYERIFHSRYAVGGYTLEGYGEVVAHYRRVGTGQVYSLAEAIGDGKAVLEDVHYNEDEIRIIEEAKSEMSLAEITTFNNLYAAWKGARRKFAPSSNPREYTQCDEYIALLDYCRKKDNSEYLVLEELGKGDSFVTMLVQDLTLDSEENKEILSQVKEKNVQLRSADGASIISSPYSNCMKYAKQLLARDAKVLTQQVISTVDTEARTSSKIIVDSNYLWIATTNGLVKFDKRIETSVMFNSSNGGLPEGQVVCIVKDQEDNIWVSSKGKGLGRFNGINCYIYTRFAQPFFNHMAIDKYNNKWVGKHISVFKYDDISWHNFYYRSDGVISATFTYNSLKFDNDGILWLAGQRPLGGFLSKLENDSVKYVWRNADSEDNNNPTTATIINSLAIDNDNNKWLGSNGMGLMKYDGIGFTYYNTDNSGLPDNIVYDIKKDSKGNLWLLSGKNLVKFDGTDFIACPIPYSDAFDCLELDGDDTVWLTSGTNILAKCTGCTFRRIDLNETIVGIDAVLSDNSKAFNVNADGSKLTINISLSEPSKVSLTVMDINGRQIASLVNMTSHPSGDYSYTTNLANGIYLVKYMLDGNMNIRKAIVN